MPPSSLISCCDLVTAGSLPVLATARPAKVLIKVDTTVGGVRYQVNPGEQLPGALAEYWIAAKAMDSMVACGVVEAPKNETDKTDVKVEKSESKKEYVKK